MTKLPSGRRSGYGIQVLRAEVKNKEEVILCTRRVLCGDIGRSTIDD